MDCFYLIIVLVLGSISAALSCLVYPPREETAGRLSGKPCLWRKFLIKMSSDDSHYWRSHMTPTARNICTRAVFATCSFNFGFPTYFVSRCCYGRRRRFFQKKVAQSCLTVVWQMACQRSHVCWCVSCWHHAFVLIGSVALDHLKINFAWPRRRLVSLSFKKNIVHNNLLENFFFPEIDVCVIPLFVDFVRYLTFSHHRIQI